MRPERPALIDGDAVIRYSELVQNIEIWSGLFAEAGLGEGDHIGVALRDNADFVLAVLAAANIGAVIVPIDWRVPKTEQLRLLESFNCALALVPSPGRQPEGINSIVINSAWRERAVDSELRASQAHDADAPFVILLSSGTTGVPKGCFVSHQDFIARKHRNVVTLGTLDDMRYLSCMPLCFSGGFAYCFYHLAAGNTVVLYPPLFSAEEIVTAINELHIDFTCLAPTVVRWLNDLPASDGVLLPGLKALVMTGGALSAAEKHATVTRVSDKLIDNYACAGAGQISAGFPATEITKTETVGRPHPLVDVQIVDVDDAAVPAGVLGRIRCRGDGVANRYFGVTDAAEQGDSFKDGWCYTGDLGELDSDGYLLIRGRVDDVIISGGVNIYPRVIENSLLSHPQVLEAAVIGKPSASLGQEVVAFVRSEGPLQDAALRAHCMQTLPANALPAEFQFVDDFPYTAAGKIRKHELASLLN